MNRKFDFKRHQNLGRNWRTLVRFAMYITVLLFLLFLIYNQTKTLQNELNDDSIEEFEVLIEEKTK